MRPLGDLLGAPGALLGASWGLLGRSCDFSPNFARFGLPKGCQKGAKREPKEIQNGTKTHMHTHTHRHRCLRKRYCLKNMNFQKLLKNLRKINKNEPKTAPKTAPRPPRACARTCERRRGRRPRMTRIVIGLSFNYALIMSMG